MQFQMGYAKAGQNTAGIHTRLYSRAFVFSDGVDRAVFVSVDMGMMGQLVKRYVSGTKSNIRITQTWAWLT